VHISNTSIMQFQFYRIDRKVLGVIWSRKLASLL
jgi:hypothetical protein